jgi:fatty-acyl-CoA synthase
MPVELFRRFEKATGVRILEAYGLTESACVSTLNPIDGDRRVGSIGLPLPGQPMATVVLDDAGNYLRDAAVDEVGIVAIAGPNVFEGYQSAAHNAGLWIERGDGRRWLNTGDLGRRDANGYYWLTGRKKQLIIRGGHNIDPATIEDLCTAIPTWRWPPRWGARRARRRGAGRVRPAAAGAAVGIRAARVRSRFDR